MISNQGGYSRDRRETGPGPGRCQVPGAAADSAMAPKRQRTHAMALETPVGGAAEEASRQYVRAVHSAYYSRSYSDL
jgi:hypothetical protein